MEAVGGDGDEEVEEEVNEGRRSTSSARNTSGTTCGIADEDYDTDLDLEGYVSVHFKDESVGESHCDNMCRVCVCVYVCVVVGGAVATLGRENGLLK